MKLRLENKNLSGITKNIDLFCKQNKIGLGLPGPIVSFRNTFCVVYCHVDISVYLITKKKFAQHRENGGLLYIVTAKHVKFCIQSEPKLIAIHIDFQTAIFLF